MKLNINSTIIIHWRCAVTLHLQGHFTKWRRRRAN